MESETSKKIKSEGVKDNIQKENFNKTKIQYNLTKYK